MMKRVNAIFYDGHSARQQAVTLRIVDGLLEVHGDDGVVGIPLSAMRISEKLGNTPRLLHFADGGHCEVNNHAAFESMLEDAGLKPQSLVSRMENSWQHALLATLLAIAIVIASFYWGLPWVAEVAAEKIPASLALSIDTHVLSGVDDGLMQPSRLNTARQEKLTQRFNGLRNEQGQPAHTLVFRSSKDIGANAFALPGGTIIVTDQLVTLAGNDEEILAVLTHELGHVSERHPLRQLLQSSVVGLAMTWYLGDISSLLAAAPTLLLQSSYSRNFERRADRYAADMLRLNGIAPARLADILGKLESSHSAAKAGNKQTSRLAEFFSTHPDTEERMRELRSEHSLP
jgi:Zn-dependent protease with chaperone function